MFVPSPPAHNVLWIIFIVFHVVAISHRFESYKDFTEGRR